MKLGERARAFRELVREPESRVTTLQVKGKRSKRKAGKLAGKSMNGEESWQQLQDRIQPVLVGTRRMGKTSRNDAKGEEKHPQAPTLAGEQTRQPAGVSVATAGFAK